MNKVTNKVLKALRNREEYAFDIVVEEYRELLYGIIYKLLFNKEDTEDVFIIVLQKIWDNADKIKADKEQFKNWIITIAYNQARNFLRDKQTEDKVYFDNKELMIEESKDANSILSSIYLADMQKFMTDDEYRILIYKDIKKMNYSEISKIMDISDKTVKTYYMHAKKIARKYFEGDL